MIVTEKATKYPYIHIICDRRDTDDSKMQWNDQKVS